MPPRSAPHDVSAFAPLRDRLYRALFLAQLGSNLGSWMQTVGAQEFLLQHRASALVVAAVQSAGLLPVLALSLPAGVMADALDRRRLLLGVTAVSALSAAVMCVLGIAGLLAPTGLLLLTLLLGCATALGGPAWQAVQPELVPREQIPAAASLGSVTVNAARAIGPAIAGLLVGLTGSALVFGLNAASFAGVLVVLARWRRPAGAARGAGSWTSALVDGVRYVRAAPGIRRILLRAGLFAIPASALFALLPVVARDSLHLGAGGYGALLGVLGLGSVLGVGLMPFLRRRLSSSRILAVSALVMAAALTASVLAPLAVVLPVLLAGGIAWIASLTTLNATLQLAVAPWIRARAIAVYLMVFMGGQGVASLGWGALAAAAGAAAAFLVAAGLLVLAALSVRLLPLHAVTGTLDRTITALTSDAPALVFEPEPADGPVFIAIDHHVTTGAEDRFLTAMRAVEGSRRRTGASSWSVARSGEHLDVYREEFTFHSWSVYEESRASRWTGSDRRNLAELEPLLAAPSTESHWFPVRT